MKKTTLALSLSFALLPVVSYSHNKDSNEYEYRELYVLGDSLNDSYKGKSVNEAEIYPTQMECFHQIVFHRPLVDFHKGGTNFSVWGNTVTDLTQILRNPQWFKQTQGNGHNLYYISLGANDIKNSAFLRLVGVPDFFGLKVYQQSTHKIGEYLKFFGDHGRNLLITSTVPNIAVTPFFSSLFVFPRFDIIQRENLQHPLPVLYPVAEKIYRTTAPFFESPWIRAPLNFIGINTPGSLRQKALNFQFDPNRSLAENLQSYNEYIFQGSLLSFIAGPLAHHFYEVLTRSTDQYNALLLNQVLQLKENIIFLDIQGFIQDVLKHYRELRFDAIFASACNAGTFSLPGATCMPDSPFQDDQHHYPFSDIVHPSAEAHEGLGKYALVVLNAPVQYSSLLTTELMRIDTLSNRLLQQILDIVKKDSRPGHSVGVEYVLGTYRPSSMQGIEAAKHSLNNLNISYNTIFNRHNSLNLTVSLAYGKLGGYRNYHFTTEAATLALLDVYRFNPHWYTSIEAAYSIIRDRDVRRSAWLVLLSSFHSESGDTHATSHHIAWRVGYLGEISAHSQAGFYLGLTKNRVRVNGFDEHVQWKSTAMSFNPLAFTDLFASLGAIWSYQKDSIGLSADVTFNHSFREARSNIYSGLSKFPIRFYRPVKLKERNWANLNVAFSKSLAQHNKITISTGLTRNMFKNNQYRFSLNWQKKW